MTRLLLLAPALMLSACAGGCSDEPSPYAASTPAAAAPTPVPSDADARVAEAEARAAAAEAQLAQAQAAQQAQPSASSPQPTATVSSAPYTGSVSMSGLRQFCETYERTSVARFNGLLVCYNIRIQQRGDGTFSGTGYKSVEVLAGTQGRDLPSSEQSPIRITGTVDNSETVRMQYTVEGARRATNGTATFNGGHAVNYTDVWGGTSEVFSGAFRSSAANASGSATISAYELID